MGEWGWFSVAVVGVAVLCFAAVRLFSRPTISATRLEGEEGSTSHPDLLLGDMTDVLARGTPGEGRDREEILPELIRAGAYSPTALSEYRAIRAVLVLTPLFFAAATALLVEPEDMPTVALVGAVLAIGGFSIPRLYITIKAGKRTREIERGLPIFADMMSIALLAGQGLTGAMRRVTDQLRRSFPRLTEELDIVIRQTEMLNLVVAFEQWAKRTQLTEVRNLAVLLTQSQKLGNDVTVVLMEYATHLRSGARQRADAKAQRASFWMLFPTILCLWIPAAALLIAPLYFEFSARRAKSREGAPSLSDIKKLGPNKGVPKGGSQGPPLPPIFK